jgi:xylonate dehydratase
VVNHEVAPLVTMRLRRRLQMRSWQWFDNPATLGMIVLYLERYLSYGLTGGELQSGRPMIGIAQTASDLVPCNRHHLELA